MDTTRLEFFRNRFLKMLSDYQTELKQEGLVENNKGDEVDKALEDRENLLLLKLNGRQQLYIKKIHAALRSIDEGTFGTCEECGEQIEEKRLLARPTASCCISCKEEQERLEGHLLYHKRSHTLGRTFANDNVVKLPVAGEEIHKEKVLKFNKTRLQVGLENQY